MENKKQNTTVKTEEKSLQNLVNVFNDEFFWFSNGSEEIQFSENLYQVTGYSPGEISSVSEIILKDDISTYKEALQEFNNDDSKMEISLEYRIQTKEAQLRWIGECIKVFRSENGKINKRIGRVFDITEKKAAENQLKKNLSDLQNQNNAKDKFLNVLSHDLRSPFASILGFAEIMMKESALTEAERSEYLSYIYSSSEKLLQLINYLLDWSKLQSGKLKINARRLRIQELVYNCVSSLTGTAVRKNIEIKVEIDSTAKIFGDERLLNIAITNLISNAIKYSEKDSKVYIKVSRFNDNFAEFIVKDEGIGIPEEIKRKMFRIEKMFSTPGTAGERGTGLGLTLSKEIVERHSGDFWFYSEEGKGSEFHITLPVSSNIVLIVEPDSDRRKSLVTSLEKESNNFRIISSASPYEAINNMEKILPSVVITSHEMPLMNGAQFIETIVERKNRAELKIIILTDSVNEELKNIYGKLGDAVFLSKSVTAKKLLEAVHDLVS